MSGGAELFEPLTQLGNLFNGAPLMGGMITTKSEAETNRRHRDALAQQAKEADEKLKRQVLAEQKRVEALPRNMRNRAENSARSLGDSGKRPTASQYLAGS